VTVWRNATPEGARERQARRILRNREYFPPFGTGLTPREPPSNTAPGAKGARPRLQVSVLLYIRAREHGRGTLFTPRAASYLQVLRTYVPAPAPPLPRSPPPPPSRRDIDVRILPTSPPRAASRGEGGTSSAPLASIIDLKVHPRATRISTRKLRPAIIAPTRTPRTGAGNRSRFYPLR
jgi:hypothetical protein